MPPETCDREISADLQGKERQGKRKNGAEKMENKRREGGNFFFFFFCFSLFKTTEICFGSTKMGIFYREKNFISRREKNPEK